MLKKANSNNIIVGKNANYNLYGRNIPGSAQSHYRKYGNNNQMEVSTTATQQVQQGVFDCVPVLLKGLNKDELLYILEHIDKKISKIYFKIFIFIIFYFIIQDKDLIFSLFILIKRFN